MKQDMKVWHLPYTPMRDTYTIEGQSTKQNGEYDLDQYEVIPKCVGTQQWIADAWAEMKLPANTTKLGGAMFASSTRNFRGHQYPDGHGKLKHYKTLEAIRTRNLTTIINAECWSRGWAHCSTPHSAMTPKKELHTLPLTTLNSRRNDLPDIYDISEVVKAHKKQGSNHEYLSSGGWSRLVVYRTEGDNGNVEETFVPTNKEDFGAPMTERQADEFVAEITR